MPTETQIIEELRAHIERILSAANQQMGSTGMPSEFIDVVRGVQKDTGLTEHRIKDLENRVITWSDRAKIAEDQLDVVRQAALVLNDLHQASMVASGGEGLDQCTYGCAGPGEPHTDKCPWRRIDDIDAALDGET